MRQPHSCPRKAARPAHPPDPPIPDRIERNPSLTSAKRRRPWRSWPTGDPLPAGIPNSDQWSISPTLGGVPRGDGRLNHDLLPGEKGPQDACGVFGVWAPGEEVAKLTYFGLYALQHRGQESAGIAVSNGSQILVFKDMGLVSQVFDETSLGSLQGHIAVGHARYSTTGASVWENAQPTFRATAHGSIALGHNGNLVNTAQLAEMVADLPKQDGRATQVAAHQRHRPGHRAARRPDRRRRQAADRRGGRPPGPPAGQGRLLASSSWTSTPSTPPATRRASARWSSAGWSAAGWSRPRPPPSTSCGATFVREIEPGELVAIDENGLRTSRFAEAKPKGCVFEYVYLARPDTDIAGRNVYLSRVEMGRKLAKEAPVEADLVIATPESGTPAAIGYAEASPASRTAPAWSRTPTSAGPSSSPRRPSASWASASSSTRSRKSSRASAWWSSTTRSSAATPSARWSRMLREAGARRGPHPDLLAAGEVALLLRHRLRHPRRADRQRHDASTRSAPRSAPTRSRTSPSTAMIEATTIAKPNLCRACFDGEYPMELPDPELLGKQLLETELAAGAAPPRPRRDAVRRP